MHNNKTLKKLKYNTISGLLLQIISVIISLLIPKIIITAYGSATNGLISSVSQFLGYIALLQAGIGAVSRAALYEPLNNNDTAKISSIVSETARYFRILAIAFVVYDLVLAFVYPMYISREFEFSFTFSLILIIAISTFCEYYFGIANMIFLQAKQDIYIINLLQICTSILYGLVVFFAARVGLTVHLMRLIVALVYTLKPIALYFIVKNYYRIKNIKQSSNENRLKQKGDALGQHIAFYLHSNTDIALLSIFKSLSDVSVYSYHNTISNGIQKVVSAVVSNFEPVMGQCFACDNKKLLKETFIISSRLSSVLSIVLFASASCIVPRFMDIYLKDATYIRPQLAIIMLFSESLYCFRMSEVMLVTAAGKFKQTNLASFGEAAINIILSLVLIVRFGMEGIILATVIGTAYRFVYLDIYIYKHMDIEVKSYCVRKAILFLTEWIIAYTISRLVLALLETTSILTLFIAMVIICLVNFVLIVILDYITMHCESQVVLNYLKNARKVR